MIMNELKSIKSEMQDLKKFGKTLGIAFFILFFLLFFIKKTWYIPIAITGLALTALGFIFPKALFPLQKIWMAISVILGWFITLCILGVIFYLIFTPIGMVSKVIGKKFLLLGFDNSKKSYWVKKENTPSKPEDYEKQF